METREEHVQDIDSARSGLGEKVGQIVGGHQVVSSTAETNCGCGCHICLTGDETRNQVK